MPHSGHFTASSASSEWTGGSWPALAVLCELAHLTEAEAETTLLYCRGMSYASIAFVRQVRYRSGVCDCLHRATGKLGRLLARYQPELLDRRRRHARTLLLCFRNSRSSGGVLLLGWNKYREEWLPQQLRGQIVTSDDLVRDPGLLLEVLAQALKDGELARLVDGETVVRVK